MALAPARRRFPPGQPATTAVLGLFHFLSLRRPRLSGLRERGRGREGEQSGGGDGGRAERERWKGQERASSTSLRLLAPAQPLPSPCVGPTLACETPSSSSSLHTHGTDPPKASAAAPQDAGAALAEAALAQPTGPPSAPQRLDPPSATRSVAEALTQQPSTAVVLLCFPLRPCSALLPLFPLLLHTDSRCHPPSLDSPQPPGAILDWRRRSAVTSRR